MKRIIIALAFIGTYITFDLFADETYWESQIVRPYVHNSELQRRWAWAFLAPHLQQLNGDESILDIGCGDGRITSDLSKFVSNGFVVGIDPSKPMLEWAQRQYCSMEYPNLSFKEGGFLEPGDLSTFDVIVSFCALQHCSNQQEGILQLAKHLKPGGKVLIMIPALENKKWGEASRTIQALPQWSAYWKGFLPRKIHTLEEYAAMMTKANLHPQRIEKVHTLDPFVDREEFLCFLLGTLPPVIPKEMRRQFWNEVIDEYLRLLPDVEKSNGTIEARFGRIEIEAII